MWSILTAYKIAAINAGILVNGKSYSISWSIKSEYKYMYMKIWQKGYEEIYDKCQNLAWIFTPKQFHKGINYCKDYKHDVRNVHVAHFVLVDGWNIVDLPMAWVLPISGGK